MIRFDSLRIDSNTGIPSESWSGESVANNARCTGIESRVVGSKEKVVAMPSSNTNPGGGVKADVYKLRASGFSTRD